LAERYPSTEPLEPGDVVLFDRTPSDKTTVFDQSKTDKTGTEVAGKKIPVAVRKSSVANQPGVIGVVSTAPGVRLHDPDDDKNPPIALVGRVPVKVTIEGGPIKIGDYLTSSSKPGRAMKAVGSVPMVAIALEAFDGKKDPDGKILAFVRAGDGDGAAIRRLEEQNRSLSERLERLEKAAAGPR
jgi:hypothetical protein